MLPVRYIRHHIENTFTHLDDYWRPNRSYQQLSQGADPEPVYTGVRAYDTFIDSLFHARRDDQLTARSDFRCMRRVFVIAAHRGLGKGVFLSALSSGVGIELSLIHI